MWTSYNEARWPGAHRVALQGKTIVRRAGFVTLAGNGSRDVLKRNPCACDPDVGMNRKAAGPDGISAQNLLTMPNNGWEHFTAMICRFENLRQFEL